MAHTPQQGSRVRPHLPEASPFSSVLARLPDLSPPRTKYTTSFSSLNPLSSPAPPSTFGFRPQSTAQTPGGPSDASKAAAFDLLGGTPMKSVPAEQQLGSPRFELQSPKFPLFQPSPKKPLDSLRSPPTVRLGESTAAPVRSFSSPFGSLLDGSSRTAPSPADGGAAGPSPPARGSASAPRRQQRFAALFAQAGGALDAALGGSDELPAPLGLDPAYLSPLRPPSGSAAPRRSSSGGDGPAAAAEGAAEDEQQEGQAQPGAEQHGNDAATAGMMQQDGNLAAAGGGSEADDMAGPDVLMAAAGLLQGRASQYEDEQEEEEEGEEGGMDDEDDEDYTASASFRQPPLRRRPTTGAGASRSQQLFMPSQRPMRRRMLQFGAGGGMQDDEVEASPLLHSALPQSPVCQPVRMDVDMLLPIPKLRDPSTSEDGSGSPMHRLRSGGYSLDSPAVQAAAHAAVAAALEASAGGAGGGPSGSRRPARAAAAGAAAAAKAAAEAAGTPVQRRVSGHLARTNSVGGSMSSALQPLTPEDGMVPQAVFAGPKKCNCKKSKCLKLYCDCFANGGFCGPSCSCVNCANKVENSELVRKQRDSIKQRNPNAFVQKIEADAMVGGQHRRGCNCRKSHCMKKYCECFQAGVPCGEHCKCESCYNTVGQASRRPPGGGGASKRARASGTTAAPPARTRQPSTRLAAHGALSQQLKHAHSAAAASLHAVMAHASASLGGASADSDEEDEDSMQIKQEQQQQQHGLPPMLFPIMQPGMLQGGDGAPPLMIPIMLQPATLGVAGAGLPGMLPAATAAPALAAFAAAAAGQAGEGAAGAAPSHSTPVAALVGPAGTAGGDKGTPAGPGFSFHPVGVDGSGSSSGHSTPRAAGRRAAAAAADLAFSLDTPAAIAAGAGGGSMLERLLPVANANGAATAAALAGSRPAAGGRPASARTTPTKRKPQRTMTAALM